MVSCDLFPHYFMIHVNQIKGLELIPSNETVQQLTLSMRSKEALMQVRVHSLREAILWQTEKHQETRGKIIPAVSWDHNTFFIQKQTNKQKIMVNYLPFFN